VDFSKVIDVLRALGTEGVRYVLVGGVAVNLHGLGRTTQDLDLFLPPDADNIRKLKAALMKVFSDPSIAEISAEDLAGDYPTVRYVPPDESFVIDLLARLGDAFRFEDLEAADMNVEGVVVRVATPRTLYRMKKDTLRPVDRMDAEALRRKFHLSED
jgi:predicted nucleotidyltransferase